MPAAVARRRSPPATPAARYRRRAAELRERRAQLVKERAAALKQITIDCRAASKSAAAALADLRRASAALVKARRDELAALRAAKCGPSTTARKAHAKAVEQAEQAVSDAQAAALAVPASRELRDEQVESALPAVLVPLWRELAPEIEQPDPAAAIAVLVTYAEQQPGEVAAAIEAQGEAVAASMDAAAPPEPAPAPPAAPAPRAAPAPSAAAAVERVTLILAGRGHADTHKPAREFYQSPLFREQLQEAERQGRKVFVLSLFNGLLRPDDPVLTDLRLSEFTQRERKKVATELANELFELVPGSAPLDVELLAGVDFNPFMARALRESAKRAGRVLELREPLRTVAPAAPPAPAAAPAPPAPPAALPPAVPSPPPVFRPAVGFRPASEQGETGSLFDEIEPAPLPREVRAAGGGARYVDDFRAGLQAWPGRDETPMLLRGVLLVPAGSRAARELEEATLEDFDGAPDSDDVARVGLVPVQAGASVVVLDEESEALGLEESAENDQADKPDEEPAFPYADLPKADRGAFMLGWLRAGRLLAPSLLLSLAKNARVFFAAGELSPEGLQRVSVAQVLQAAGDTSLPLRLALERLELLGVRPFRLVRDPGEKRAERARERAEQERREALDDDEALREDQERRAAAGLPATPAGVVFGPEVYTFPPGDWRGDVAVKQGPPRPGIGWAPTAKSHIAEVLYRAGSSGWLVGTRKGLGPEVMFRVGYEKGPAGLPWDTVVSAGAFPEVVQARAVADALAAQGLGALDAEFLATNLVTPDVAARTTVGRVFRSIADAAAVLKDNKPEFNIYTEVNTDQSGLRYVTPSQRAIWATLETRYLDDKKGPEGKWYQAFSSYVLLRDKSGDDTATAVIKLTEDQPKEALPTFDEVSAFMRAVLGSFGLRVLASINARGNWVEVWPDDRLPDYLAEVRRGALAPSLRRQEAWADNITGAARKKRDEQETAVDEKEKRISRINREAIAQAPPGYARVSLASNVRESYAPPDGIKMHEVELGPERGLFAVLPSGRNGSMVVHLPSGLQVRDYDSGPAKSKTSRARAMMLLFDRARVDGQTPWEWEDLPGARNSSGQLRRFGERYSFGDLSAQADAAALAGVDPGQPITRAQMEAGGSWTLGTAPLWPTRPRATRTRNPMRTPPEQAELVSNCKKASAEVRAFELDARAVAGRLVAMKRADLVALRVEACDDKRAAVRHELDPKIAELSREIAELDALAKLDDTKQRAERRGKLPRLPRAAADQLIESTLAVMEPRLVPLWREVGADIDGPSAAERLEVFAIYARENPGEVASALAAQGEALALQLDKLPPLVLPGDLPPEESKGKGKGRSKGRSKNPSAGGGGLVVFEAPYSRELAAGLAALGGGWSVAENRWQVPASREAEAVRLLGRSKNPGAVDTVRGWWKDLKEGWKRGAEKARARRKQGQSEGKQGQSEAELRAALAREPTPDAVWVDIGRDVARLKPDADGGGSLETEEDNDPEELIEQANGKPELRKISREIVELESEETNDPGDRRTPEVQAANRRWSAMVRSGEIKPIWSVYQGTMPYDQIDGENGNLWVVQRKGSKGFEVWHTVDYRRVAIVKDRKQLDAILRPLVRVVQRNRARLKERNRILLKLRHNERTKNPDCGCAHRELLRAG